MDRDGVLDFQDNCPNTWNPDQWDVDGDMQGDACDPDIDNDGQPNGIDPCPFDPLNFCPPFDKDSDGVPDVSDKCPNSPNPDPTDTDGDNIPDVCDPDLDNDGIDNTHDACPWDFENLCNCHFTSIELPIYGLGRVGVARPDINIELGIPPDTVYTRYLTDKFYELKDHLGNVRMVISDLKRSVITGGVPGDFHADVRSYTNPYPYGMAQPGRWWDGSLEYRYGFNGVEQDREVKGDEWSHFTTPYRQYDPRVGRWWTNDRITHSWESPYAAMAGNPAALTDPSGACSTCPGGTNDPEPGTEQVVTDASPPKPEKPDVDAPENWYEGILSPSATGAPLTLDFGGVIGEVPVPQIPSINQENLRGIGVDPDQLRFYFQAPGDYGEVYFGFTYYVYYKNEYIGDLEVSPQWTPHEYAAAGKMYIPIDEVRVTPDLTREGLGNYPLLRAIVTAGFHRKHQIWAVAVNDLRPTVGDLIIGAAGSMFLLSPSTPGGGKQNKPSSINKANVSTKIHEGKQGKHVVGHNNYKAGRSILKVDAQTLLDDFHSGNVSSTEHINDTKTRVDFGRTIGDFIDHKTGEAIPTTRGIIHTSTKGAHIVPSAPN